MTISKSSQETTYGIQEMKEIRPGRTLMTQNISLPMNNMNNSAADVATAADDDKEEAEMSSQEATGSDSDHNNDDHDTIQILFIHGSCAASSQYHSLIEAMNEILISNNATDTSSTKEERQKMRFNCHLFDHLGCGLSKHSPNDWYAYSATEQFQDLVTITKSIILPNNSDNNNNTTSEETKQDQSDLKPKSLYIVAHSYGVSQALQLVNFLSSTTTNEKEYNIYHESIKGLILIGGAVKGGSSPVLTKDGGHWIFTYLPMFALQRMQPSLTDGFVKAAFHPSCENVQLLERATNDCNQNDMRFCKAFYRQQSYLTEDEANKVQTKALIIHGKDDLILPSSAGEHLKKTLRNTELHVINDTSHQVFQEKPKEVASLIVNFLTIS